MSECRISILNWLWNFMARIGQHTLYIFLYHYYIAFTLIPMINERFNVKVENAGLNAIIYYGMMIGGSIIIEYVVTKVEKFLTEIYFENKY